MKGIKIFLMKKKIKKRQCAREKKYQNFPEKEKEKRVSIVVNAIKVFLKMKTKDIRT